VRKLDYARILAACLLYFSQRQRDRVGLATFDADIVEFIPPSTRHLPLALHALGRATAGQPGDLRAAMRKLAESYRRRGILVLVSDLYEEPDVIISALHEIRGAGSDVIVMHVLDPAELDFPFEDAASFQDMEGELALPVVPPAMRVQYRALVQEHIATLRRQIGESGMDYLLLDTRRSLDHALYEYLALRERLARVR
jgi:Mg-chelatase subunit ChlD